jgi:hypothetical protein
MPAIEISRFFTSRFFNKPLLDPGGRFASNSKTAARQFQKPEVNSRCVSVSEVKRLQINSSCVALVPLFQGGPFDIVGPEETN